MEVLYSLFQAILHIDHYLISFVATYGIWTYAILFAVIFCETGLVITPFLPGDSLLFAAGSLAANVNNVLDIRLLFILLLIASILGNKLNYLIGLFVGPKVFSAEKSWLLNKKHLQTTHAYYAKYGAKTIIIARFIPIIRTFAPFIAGIGAMSIARFSIYNIISALLWVGGLLALGYFFGNLPIVKDNFSIVIYTIILVSVLLPAMALICQKLSSSN